MILYFGALKMIKKKTNQKPIEHDIHLKYLCSKCGQSHWLSFKEASTKHYKIVCDCDNVFTVKRVKGFKIKYASAMKENKKPDPVPVAKTNTNSISADLLNNAIKSLIGLGFTKSEAKDLLIKVYNESPTNDIGYLVKKTLESLKNVK